MTHKKSTVLLSLLAGVLISPVSGNGSPVAPVGSEANSAESLYQLGVMRMNGEGAQQDIVQGRYWIHLAARHGYPLAQYNLGVMYFDGIGGSYSRPCAQWWLNMAAAQDDPEVQEMAGLALRRIEPEMAALPKIYRPVTALECDRLPEWQREVRPAADIPVLPEGDIDTEAMVMVQDPPVTGQTAAPEDQAVVPGVAAEKTETGTVKETVDPAQTFSETETTALPVSEAEDSGTETGMVNEAVIETVAVSGTSETEAKIAGAAEQKTPAENPAETAISSDTRVMTDTTSAGEITTPETGNADAEVLASGAVVSSEQNAEAAGTAETADVPVSADDRGDHRDITSAHPGMTQTPDAESFRTTVKESTGNQVAGAEVLSGAARKNTEMSADALPEKPKTLKPREIRPATVPAVLNLGGSPETAPGRHYTLQLSGGTTSDELYRTARRHKLTNYLIYETVRHGQRWYVLVGGEYATLTAANQALKALPAELRRNGPWVRSLRGVQNELRKNETGTGNTGNP